MHIRYAYAKGKKFNGGLMGTETPTDVLLTDKLVPGGVFITASGSKGMNVR